MMKRLHSLFKQIFKKEIVAHLSRVIINKLKILKQEYRKIKMLQMKNINVVINEQEKQFSQIERKKF